MAVGVLAMACGPTQESLEGQHVPSTRTSPLSVSPELPVFAPTGQQLEPAVASGNGVHLVVWTEVLPSSQKDIYGARIRNSDGALLDAQPLRIAEGPATQSVPSVAFDGNNFLVVWSQTDGGGDIFATRVSAANGAVLDTPHLISRTSNGAPSYGLSPDVAFDGTNYLVVWQSQGGGVSGIRVRASDGQPIEPASFKLSTYGLKPRVAYGDGRFLVVWYIARHYGNDLEGVRIDAASGALLDTAPRTLTPSGQSDFYPDVASRGDQFLVVWQADSKLRAIRVRGSDGANLDGSGFIVSETHASPPAVTFDTTDYRVSWQGYQNGARKLFTTRISTLGALTPGAEVLLSSMDPSSQTTRADIAAASKGHFVVAYHQFDASSRVKLRLVEDESTQEPPQDPPGEPCDATQLSLVLNGAADMTLECGSGPYLDPGAQAFDGCGNPLQVHAYNTGTDASGPGPLMSTEGSYTVSYAAWDDMGHTVNASRLVRVDDRKAPTLSLRGSANMVHMCGSQWVDPGVDAIDACYGDVSAQVWRTGEVNGWAEGTYTVTYKMTDTGGNSAVPVSRTVYVVNCPW